MKTCLLALGFTTGAVIAQEIPRKGITTAPHPAGSETMVQPKSDDSALVARALQLESSHEWAKARGEYETVLQLHPNHAAALAGKARVSEVIVAELQLEKCIAEAERLTALNRFQAAIRVFNRAMAVKPHYLDSARFRALRTKLMEQNTPVDVTINSDGQTSVSIEHFSGPRKLDTVTIKVLPGDYRVIGRRNGYQDSARPLIVRSGAPQAIAIVCNIPTSAAASKSDWIEEARFEEEYQRGASVQRFEEAKEKVRFDAEMKSIRERFIPTVPATAGLAGEPAVGPVPSAVRTDLQLASFYEKYVEAGGLPIVGSARVSDYALLEARHLVLQMIGHRPELLRAIAQNDVRFAVMACDEFTTTIPEHSNLRPADYWDSRARGLGTSKGQPFGSCGEENLLGYPGDPYAGESVLVHEFGHVIHDPGMSTIDPTFDRRLEAAFAAARRDGLWQNTYAATNRSEYWAVGVGSWFDTNRESDDVHNAVNTRAELKAYDPRLAALLSEVLGDGAWRYEPPAKRSPASPHLAGFDARKARHFEWPAHLVAVQVDFRDAGAVKTELALAPLAPGSRADWRSPGGNTMLTLLDFENPGPAPVTLDWIDLEGQPKDRFTLARGETRRFGTAAGHVWRATDESDALLGYFVASERPAVAVVQGSAKAEVK